MYEDSKNFNWLSLFIKVIIFAIFILLAIWLVTKVISKADNNSFEKNMNIMKEASIEYFKKGNLPQEQGDSKKITLGDLIKMKYIATFDKKCDRQKSYSQATLVDDYYALRVELTCGSKKDYIYTSIDKNGNCVGNNCTEDKKDKNKTDNKKNDNKQDDKNNSSGANSGNNNGTGSSNNNSTPSKGSSGNTNTGSSSKPSTSGKTLYYQHAKVNKTYSNWQYNKISGNNVETKTETVKLNTYCQLITSDYYYVAYLNSINVGQTYRLTVRLNNVPAGVTYIKTVKNEFFGNNSSMYNTYLTTTPKVSFVIGSNAYGVTNNANTLMNSSLKSSNLTYKRVYYYDYGDNMVAESWIRVDNTNGVSKYGNMYFVPVHLTVQHKDKESCVTDTADNASKYNGYDVSNSRYGKVTLYRSYTYTKDYNNIKWSTSKSIDGYALTGKSEWR